MKQNYCQKGSRLVIQRITIFVFITAAAHIINSVDGLHCYECLAWMVGQPGTNEKCREDVPPSYTVVDCNGPQANILDLNTGKIRTHIPGDMSSRAINDPVCVKINGTERRTSHHVVFRACAVALVDEEINGVCQIVDQEFAIPGYLTMAPGSKHFHCTDNKCNTGPVSGLCGGVEGDGHGSGGSGNGRSSSLGSAIVMLISFILMLFNLSGFIITQCK